MSVKCYYAPPEASYYSCSYSPDHVPSWVPEDVLYGNVQMSQWEAEMWQPRDYHDYLRNTYPAKRDANITVVRPQLKVVSPRPVCFPFFKKKSKAARPAPIIRPRSEIINPHEFNIDEDTLRDASARGAYIVKRILHAIMVRGSTGAEDLIAQIILAVEFIKKVVESESKPPLSAKGKPEPRQPRLFET